MNDTSLRLSLLYEWILNQIDSEHFHRPQKILDLGSKDFSYAVGLTRWVKKFHESPLIVGLELDPYQTYWNGHKRGDVGSYHSQMASEMNADVRYEAGDWLEWNPNFQPDLITHFFPFLFEDLHERFGLPSKSFSPLEYYAKSIQSARQGMIFFHQGKAEAKESKEILYQLGGGRIVQKLRIKENPYLDRKFPIEVLVWKKSEDLDQ